jgi:hypothetical protein
VIARVSGTWDNDVAVECYRVLARSTFWSGSDNLAADDASGSVSRGPRVCLGRAGPSQSGRGKQGKRDATDEDKQSKQNAQIEESGLSSVFLFHG